VPEKADAVDDFFDRFQDHDFLTGSHADHRVGSRLNLLDQIAIQHYIGMVKTSEMDHDRVSPDTSAVGRGLSIEIYR
jgi:hypothetical protein